MFRNIPVILVPKQCVLREFPICFGLIVFSCRICLPAANGTRYYSLMNRPAFSLVGLLAIVVGCFSPTFPNGVQCAENSRCPGDQICAPDNRCYDPGYDLSDLGDSTLTNLEVSIGTLTPSFDPSVTEYEVNLGLLTSELDVTATSTFASISISGENVESGQASLQTLRFGKNEVEVVATSAESTSTTYRVQLRRGAGIAQRQAAKATNAEMDDLFGGRIAVSRDGSTIAVAAIAEDGGATGVNGDETDNTRFGAGTVYIFVRGASGWVQEAYIKASNTNQFEFGNSISLSDDGDVLAVGSINDSSASQGVDADQSPGGQADEFSGAVFLFRRTGPAWQQEVYIKSSNSEGGDAFGRSVSVSGNGDRLAVSANGEDSGAIGINGNQNDNSANGSGAVYMFDYNGSWSQQAYIKASNVGASDGFGTHVALSSAGDVLVVGATGEDSASTGVGGSSANDAASDSGAAYIFSRSGPSWNQSAYLKASNTEAQDRFGSKVAISPTGDFVLVASTEESSAAVGFEGEQSDNSAIRAGAAYLFFQGGQGWRQELYIKASNSDEGDTFARSIALSDNLMAICASGEDGGGQNGGDQADNSLSQSGACYLFIRDDDGWSQEAYLKADLKDDGDSFGSFVSITDSLVVVGAPGEASAAGLGLGDNSTPGAGIFYTFD